VVAVGDIETGRRRGATILYLAAALSLFAALIHLWVVPEHLEEWWGYGAFFLAAAAAQGLYGAVLLRRPGRSLFLVGIGGNLAVVALWVVTRTAGIPLFGPHAGEVEGVGVVDLCATASELGIVAALGTVMLRSLSSEKRILVLVVAAVTVVSLGHVVHLLIEASPSHGPGG
jgi:hypothetical protein